MRKKFNITHPQKNMPPFATENMLGKSLHFPSLYHNQLRIFGVVILQK
jgi:hypothetical protein